MLVILGAPISVNDTQDYPFLFEEAGRPCALALQFHLEVNPHHIEQWLIAYADYIRASEQDVAVIRREASLYAEKLTAAATEVLTGWLKKLGL
ncbi:hypothetical protein [Rothia nasimurium]|uniref:hypothetical protein n=1 Tax=Rothia nasimurium TaxID=85336 RepID=UPI001ADD8F8B|nr:hypothetical protein [Rothia nasimurium]